MAPAGLPEPSDLLAATEAVVAPADLAGLEVLVTAGGTREPIDAVRFIGNRSSGRMGFALASEAARRGARVTVVCANVSLERDPRVEYVDVQTARELADACLAAFARADVLLMAAAVADYRPAETFAGKVKKDEQGEDLTLHLERTDNVLSELSRLRREGQTLVGFAAEAGAGAVAYGRGKLERKFLDAVVVNDVAAPGIGFDSLGEARFNHHRDVQGETVVAQAPKEAVARAIIDLRLAERTSSDVKVTT